VVEIYVKLIAAGHKVLGDVPEVIRAQVAARLAEVDGNA
jgi:hypothetical protein